CAPETPPRTGNSRKASSPDSYGFECRFPQLCAAAAPRQARHLFPEILLTGGRKCCTVVRYQKLRRATRCERNRRTSERAHKKCFRQKRPRPPQRAAGSIRPACRSSSTIRDRVHDI